MSHLDDSAERVARNGRIRDLRYSLAVESRSRFDRLEVYAMAVGCELGSTEEELFDLRLRIWERRLDDPLISILDAFDDLANRDGGEALDPEEALDRLRKDWPDPMFAPVLSALQTVWGQIQPLAS